MKINRLGRFVIGAGIFFAVCIPDAVSAYSDTPTSQIARSIPGSASVSLTWEAANLGTRYQAQLRVGTSTGAILRTSDQLSTNTRSYLFTGLEYNLSYVALVRAGDASGWGSYVATTFVIPEAASPTAPPKPVVASDEDGQITATWSAPTSNGGAVLSKYSVQLYQGGEALISPATTTGTSYTFKDLSLIEKYSVSVKAINSESKISQSSETSDAISPVKEAALSLGIQNPAGGGNNQVAGGGNNVAVKTPANLVSALPALLPYSKLVTLKSTTSKTTLTKLSGLKVPKGAKTSFAISGASKKICSVKGSGVYMLKKGTCSVTFTVTPKKGKKTSRTVKLILR